MIEEIIKLLNIQLDGFHRKVEQNPKDAKLQAQYWELIAQQEEIIHKAKNALLSDQLNGPREKRKKTSYPKTAKSIEIQNAIYGIIKSHGGTASHSEIAKALQIKEHLIYHYFAMLIDDKSIIRISPRMYAIKGATSLCSESINEGSTHETC